MRTQPNKTPALPGRKPFKLPDASSPTILTNYRSLFWASLEMHTRILNGRTTCLEPAYDPPAGGAALLGTEQGDSTTLFLHVRMSLMFHGSGFSVYTCQCT